jgi:hypothetical protein
MQKNILMAIGALALLVQIGCGGDSNNNNNDMIDTKHDMGPTECPKPSDTCVTLTSTSTHKDIINGCVAGDVVKEDITPFYPTQGYTNCKLPTAP